MADQDQKTRRLTPAPKRNHPQGIRKKRTYSHRRNTKITFVNSWADLKKAVARIPDNLLKEPVRIWTDDEQCYVISDVERLREDYVFDGDEYYTAYPKGCRIINATR